MGVLNMAVTIGNKNIDEKYSKIVEPNLYADAIFQPGVTYTDKYKEDSAGGIYVHKLGAKTIVPALPGSDYTHTADADSLIRIAMNNEYKYSEKIYEVLAAQVGYDVAVAELEDIIKTCKEARDVSGQACLAYEGTAVTGVAITPSNVKESIIGLRKELTDKKCKPTTLIVSTAVYAAILTAAGTDFVPTTNEKVLSEARVGKWLGFDIYESPLLNTQAAKYYDYTDTLRTVDLRDVNMIAYDKEALSILDTLTNERIVDAVDFYGSLAQVNIVCGYRVTNSNCVVVRKTTTNP